MKRASTNIAFTLVELLCVIGIIALLASLIFPAVGQMRQHADSVVCSNNLRNIGVAVQSYLADHNSDFPVINSDPNNPYYQADYQPTPQTMQQAFGPYGISDKTLQCPTDIKQPGGGSYASYGNSYDWKPYLDNENSHDALVYGRRMQFAAKLSKFRLVFDDTPVHFGHMNALYADGHVVAYSN